MGEVYHVIGMMSGTSLDGLDMALVRFAKEKNWSFQILKTATVEYHEDWKHQLRQAMTLSALDLSLLDVRLGDYFGSQVSGFLANSHVPVDFISSHGHTVFHQPHLRMTTQIGSPAHISVAAGLPVVADFRSQDVAMGGQGAPLVPAGDEWLFSEYDLCLNLGGIANISYRRDGQRIAFDICPCNMALNALASGIGLPFDPEARYAGSGTVHVELLKELDGFDFYSSPHPKSLGREFFDHYFWSAVMRHDLSITDKLATCTEHIARQISAAIPPGSPKKMLVTGGGAFNTHLMNRLRALSGVDVEIPGDELVQFKEALIFAFLGVLRWRGEVNCLASVTGAPRDHCSGAVCGVVSQ